MEGEDMGTEKGASQGKQRAVICTHPPKPESRF